MSTLSELESAVARLSVPELIELERVVQHALDDRRNLTTSSDSQRPRVLGLHTGAWTVADEFDAPLGSPREIIYPPPGSTRWFPRFCTTGSAQAREPPRQAGRRVGYFLLDALPDEFWLGKDA